MRKDLRLQSRSQRTYRSFRPGKVAVITLICLFLAAALIFTSLFFGLRKYIAYDDQGDLYLDIPWLAEYMQSGGGTDSTSPE